MAPEYVDTRHNAGFMVGDMMAREAGVLFESKRYGDMARIKVKNCELLLLKPSTFMNLSGQSVTEAMSFFHIPPERTLIVFDDISLDVGRTRIRLKGSAGGHNGMKNIIYLSGSDLFPRMKIGVGSKPEGWDLADWVLSRFTNDEMKTLKTVSENVTGAVELLLSGAPDKAMNRYNS